MFRIYYFGLERCEKCCNYLQEFLTCIIRGVGSGQREKKQKNNEEKQGHNAAEWLEKCETTLESHFHAACIIRWLIYTIGDSLLHLFITYTGLKDPYLVFYMFVLMRVLTNWS